jgi:hypothetical protein
MTVDQKAVDAYHWLLELENLDLPRWDPETDEVRYKIVQTQGCALTFGSLPMSALPELLESAPADSMLDSTVARMAGANLACGLPHDLDILSARLRPAAIERTRAYYKGSELSDAAIEWIAVGDRGNSSDALFYALSGIRPDELGSRGVTAHPSDTSDLIRCRRMLEKLPELAATFRTKAPVMSSHWAGICAAWDKLCACMDSECANWRDKPASAPKLDAMLREATLSN